MFAKRPFSGETYTGPLVFVLGLFMVWVLNKKFRFKCSMSSLLRRHTWPKKFGLQKFGASKDAAVLMPVQCYFLANKYINVFLIYFDRSEIWNSKINTIYFISEESICNLFFLESQYHEEKMHWFFYFPRKYLKSRIQQKFWN